MKKILIAAVTVAAAWMPATALAGAAPAAIDTQHAIQDCRALRDGMNNQIAARTFRRAYGTAAAERKDAFARCVSLWAREELENRENAITACSAERSELGVSAFRHKYGTAAAGWSDAFGRCVSGKRRAESRADRAETMNAARTCQAERLDTTFADSHDGKTFAEFYGTPQTNANAFGRCVSMHAKSMHSTST